MAYKIIILSILLTMTVCDLGFLISAGANNARPNKVIDFMVTRPCFKNFSAGECDGLSPAASACVWKPHAKSGWCAHKINGSYSNLFDI
jgi:hypothetical protein